MKRLVLTGLLASLAGGGCNGEFRNPFSRARNGAGEVPELGPGEDAHTILLEILRDPATHVRDANYYREMLEKNAGWKGVFVIHKAGHSELFWGRYSSVGAAQENLGKAKAYRPPSGDPIFAKAIVVPLPGKDIGPAEWNLKNAKAAYSLLVAVFKDDPERKYVGRRRRAVELCEQLRKSHCEAYFHHGRTSSDVTVGAFPPQSIGIRRTRTGPQLDIRDPKIRLLQKQFPHLLLNGNTIADVRRDPRTGRIISRQIKTTYPVRIPGSGQSNGQ